MTDPIPVPIKGRRRKRVLISSRDMQKLERARRRLSDLTNSIVLNNPMAAKAVCPPSTLKTCRELVAEYIASRVGAASSTVHNQSRALNRLVDWFGPRPFSRELLEQFVIDLHKSDYAPGSKWLIGRNVATFLIWLKQSGRTTDDWRAGLKFPKQSRQVPRQPYAPDEVAKLIEVAGEKPIRFVILLAYSTGLALHDACNLTWQCVDMDAFCITNPRVKTKVEAMITFGAGSSLHMALQRQQAETIHSFGSLQPGFPVCKWAHNNKVSVAVCFRKLCEKAQVEYKSFHSFRATMLTDLVNGSVPMNVALKVAGLSTVGQLIAYASTTPKDVRGHMSQLRK